MAPRSLRGHRALTATVVNASDGPLELDARDLALVGDDGEPLKAAVQFDGVAHAKVTQLAPGASVLMVAAWRGGPAAELRFGDERLSLLPVDPAHQVRERDSFA